MSALSFSVDHGRLTGKVERGRRGGKDVWCGGRGEKPEDWKVGRAHLDLF